MACSGCVKRNNTPLTTPEKRNTALHGRVVNLPNGKKIELAKTESGKMKSIKLN